MGPCFAVWVIICHIFWNKNAYHRYCTVWHTSYFTDIFVLVILYTSVGHTAPSIHINYMVYSSIKFFTLHATKQKTK